MGTRHLVCVFYQGKWWIAQYGQWDGYPEVQGVRIFRFLSVARNIEDLKAGLAHVYVPTKDELDAISGELDAWESAQQLGEESSLLAGLVQGARSTYPYPSLSRNTSSKLLGLIAGLGKDDAETEEPAETETAETAVTAVTAEAEHAEQAEKKKGLPVQLDLAFANDVLFCEWAYVIDLDTEVLEVYGGGEKKRDGHRFNDIGAEDAPVPRLGCSIPFKDLYLMTTEDEFLARVKAGFPGGDGGDDDEGEGGQAVEPAGEE